MKKIVIDFRDDLKELVKSGKKTCTVRRFKHGDVGDYFELENGYAYVLTEVTEDTLENIGWAYYRQEGYSNFNAFLKDLKDIYSGNIGNDKKVWVHCFRRLQKEDNYE